MTLPDRGGRQRVRGVRGEEKAGAASWSGSPSPTLHSPKLRERHVQSIEPKRGEAQNRKSVPRLCPTPPERSWLENIPEAVVTHLIK